MWSSNKLAPILLVCASTLVAGVASAQTPSTPATEAAPAQEPSPADVASAKAQFAEALDLRAKGDHAGALQHFRAAYGFVPTPITGLEVGRTLAELGRTAEARAVLVDAANMPKKPNESDRAAQARAEAAKLAAELEAKLGTLDVHTDPDVESVTVDDKAIASGAREPVRVDPGHHVVVVRAAKGRVGRAEVDVAAGERKDVQVAAVADPSTGPKTRLRVSPVAYVGFGVAGVGVVLGAITGIGAFTTASSLKTSCPNNLCPPSAQGTHSASLALGTTSTIAFIVGGVGAAVGVVGLLLSKRVSVEQTSLVFGPGSVMLRGEF